jgi:hypothetical protein
MNRMKSKDPDIRASFGALRRAARRARKLAAETHTPVYVMRNGRIMKEWPSRKGAESRRRQRG